MSNVYPTELKQIDASTLSIQWSDQSERWYKVRDLRLHCGCAHCKDEWTGQKLVQENQVPEDIVPLRIAPVGRYALQMFWSDGHNTGIYSFEQLYRLGQTTR